MSTSSFCAFLKVQSCATHSCMSITTALSTVAARDLEEAKKFYSNLFGRGPDLEPMPTLAQWDIDNGGGVQVVQQPESSGSSMVTLLVTAFVIFLRNSARRGSSTVTSYLG